MSGAPCVTGLGPRVSTSLDHIIPRKSFLLVDHVLSFELQALKDPTVALLLVISATSSSGVCSFLVSLACVSSSWLPCLIRRVAPNPRIQRSGCRTSLSVSLSLSLSLSLSYMEEINEGADECHEPETHDEFAWNEVNSFKLYPARFREARKVEAEYFPKMQVCKKARAQKCKMPIKVRCIHTQKSKTK